MSMKTLTRETNEGIYAQSGEKITVKGYGASGGLVGGEKLKPMDIQRNKPGADEVLIEVLYCGICHSDIHQVANDWSNTIYPCVPGHEVIGRVVESGSSVSRVEIGDIVGVGCMIDSCRECEPCRDGEEQYCQGAHGPTMTYNGFFVPDSKKFNTFGGYSLGSVSDTDMIRHERHACGEVDHADRLGASVRLSIVADIVHQRRTSIR